MSLPKGIVICPACGMRTRPAARRVPCEETVQCKARVVHLQYEARGWVAASNSTAGKILEESGAPVEWAPAGVHVEQRDKGRRGRHGEVLYDDEWVNHPIAFTPKSAFRAVAALTRVQMPADFRRRVIGALWQRPDLLDALDALKRLRGGVSKSHVWALTVQAEEEAASGRAPAQVLTHAHDDDQRAAAHAAEAPAPRAGDDGHP